MRRKPYSVNQTVAQSHCFDCNNNKNNNNNSNNNKNNNNNNNKGLLAFQK